MTTEQEKAYKDWWFHSMGPLHRETVGIEESFYVGWEAALENRSIVVETLRLVAKAEVLSKVKAFLRSEASSAFLAGLDGDAQLLRLLAIRIEKFDK